MWLLNGHCSVNVPISVSRVTAVGREPWCTPCVSLSPAPSPRSEQNGYTHGNGPVVRARVCACVRHFAVPKRISSAFTEQRRVGFLELREVRGYLLNKKDKTLN